MIAIDEKDTSRGVAKTLCFQSIDRWEFVSRRTHKLCRRCWIVGAQCITKKRKLKVLIPKPDPRVVQILQMQRELKPDNPRAIQRGRRQLERYRKELVAEFGGTFTSFLDVYTP